MWDAHTVWMNPSRMVLLLKSGVSPPVLDLPSTLNDDEGP
jgi:hypothetical protein